MEGEFQVTNGVNVVPMVQLPYEEYVWLKRTVTELENWRNEWQASQAVGGLEHFNRKQAMAYLQVGSTKLWKLVQTGQIAQTEVGKTVLYPIASCRAYLNRQTSDPLAAAQRVQAVIDAKANTKASKK